MVFKNLCVLVLRTKEASALEELNRDLPTLAHILAPLTIGYVESAFLATVMSRVGKISLSFAWYLAGSPTVST